MKLQEKYASIEKDTQILAIAVLDVATAKRMGELVQAGFPLLADAEHLASDSYGVYNLLGDNLATPSVFVIDRSGKIVWKYVGKDAEDRPSAEEVLDHLP